MERHANMSFLRLKFENVIILVNLLDTFAVLKTFLLSVSAH